MKYQVINPESLGAPKGWSNGMLGREGGRVLFVAGQVASDRHGKIVSSDFVEQFMGALRNILAVVEEAGGGAKNIGRLTIFVSEMESYRGSLKPLGAAYRQLMGTHYPAMSLVEVSQLVDPEAKVEIEATAVL